MLTFQRTKLEYNFLQTYYRSAVLNPNLTPTSSAANTLTKIVSLEFSQTLCLYLAKGIKPMLFIHLLALFQFYYLFVF